MDYLSMPKGGHLDALFVSLNPRLKKLDLSPLHSVKSVYLVRVDQLESLDLRCKSSAPIDIIFGDEYINNLEPFSYTDHTFMTLMDRKQFDSYYEKNDDDTRKMGRSGWANDHMKEVAVKVIESYHTYETSKNWKLKQLIYKKDQVSLDDLKRIKKMTQNLQITRIDQKDSTYCDEYDPDIDACPKNDKDFVLASIDFWEHFLSTNFANDCVHEESGYYIKSKDAGVMNRERLDLSHSEISSLEGIKAFSSLRELYCEDNKLNCLDLSHNKKLNTLNCSNNPFLEKLILWGGQISTLNLDRTDKLSEVWINEGSKESSALRSAYKNHPNDFTVITYKYDEENEMQETCPNYNPSKGACESKSQQLSVEEPAGSSSFIFGYPCPYDKAKSVYDKLSKNDQELIEDYYEECKEGYITRSGGSNQKIDMSVLKRESLFRMINKVKRDESTLEGNIQTLEDEAKDLAQKKKSHHHGIERLMYKIVDKALKAEKVYKVAARFEKGPGVGLLAAGEELAYYCISKATGVPPAVQKLHKIVQGTEGKPLWALTKTGYAIASKVRRREISREIDEAEGDEYWAKETLCDELKGAHNALLVLQLREKRLQLLLADDEDHNFIKENINEFKKSKISVLGPEIVPGLRDIMLGIGEALDKGPDANNGS